MNTLTLWLLVSIGSTYGNAARPSVLIERFKNREDCVAVATALNAVTSNSQIHTCVPAYGIYKP